MSILSYIIFRYVPFRPESKKSAKIMEYSHKNQQTKSWKVHRKSLKFIFKKKRFNTFVYLVFSLIQSWIRSRIRYSLKWTRGSGDPDPNKNETVRFATLYLDAVSCILQCWLWGQLIVHSSPATGVTSPTADIPESILSYLTDFDLDAVSLYLGVWAGRTPCWRCWWRPLCQSTPLSRCIR